MERTKLKNLLRLFTVFFKAGTFTFAGGLAMLPVIQKEIVDKYGFMPEEEFIEYATLAQMLPGVIALNCAVFVGRRTAGTAGMLVAALGATFSAFVLMILATVLLGIVPQHGPVIGAMRGIRAAAAALILSAAFSLGRHNLKGAFAIIVMLAAFGLLIFTRISALPVIIGAGLAGLVYQKFADRRARAKEGAE